MKVAVVGCGHWGKNLVRNFADLDALSAVSDPNVELARKYAEQYSVEALSYDEVLASNCDGVVIAAPAPLHKRLAVRAFEAKKHVYVEKPLAMTLAEADEIIGAGKKADRHLMVGHLLQYHPVFIALRHKVEAGDLGRLHYLYSNRLSLGKVRSEEDVVWSFAPHDVSMLLSLAKASVGSVLCCGSDNLQDGIVDTATLHLQFKSGLKAHVMCSWLHPVKEQKLVVIGEQAMAVFDDSQEWEKKLAFYQHNIDMSQKPPLPSKKDVEYIEVAPGEPLKAECAHFLDVMAGKVISRTDGAEGRAVLNVLTAASRSLKEEVLVNV
jgi:UDP-2-acetamido-3-amino-2,3-dideoxy-glucuronate N-acetyltransferase